MHPILLQGKHCNNTNPTRIILSSIAPALITALVRQISQETPNRLPASGGCVTLIQFPLAQFSFSLPKTECDHVTLLVTCPSVAPQCLTAVAHRTLRDMVLCALQWQVPGPLCADCSRGSHDLPVQIRLVGVGSSNELGINIFGMDLQGTFFKKALNVWNGVQQLMLSHQRKLRY